MSKSELMSYNADRDEWHVRRGGRAYRLHCGECLDLYIGKTAYPCRLELDTGWYVILPETRFVLHPRTEYIVKMQE